MTMLSILARMLSRDRPQREKGQRAGSRLAVGFLRVGESKCFLRAADTLIPPSSAGGYAAVSTGPRIIPSAFVAACKIESGNVVLNCFNAANPTSLWSNFKPRLNKPLDLRLLNIL